MRHWMSKICGAMIGAAVLAGCKLDGSSGLPSKAERLAEAKQIVADCAASKCTTLNLDGRSLDDYSILSPLTHVRVLMISYTDFSNLNDIAGMTGLTELHIGETDIADLSGLSRHPNLQVLHVQQSKASDFSAIGGLRNLEELVLRGHTNLNLSFVPSNRKLKFLSLSSSSVTDLTPLTKLRNLRTLEVDYMTAPNYKPLLSIPGLKTITGVEFGGSEDKQKVLEQFEKRGGTLNYIPEIVC